MDDECEQYESSDSNPEDSSRYMYDEETRLQLGNLRAETRARLLEMVSDSSDDIDHEQICLERANSDPDSPDQIMLNIDDIDLEETRVELEDVTRVELDDVTIDLEDVTPIASRVDLEDAMVVTPRAEDETVVTQRVRQSMSRIEKQFKTMKKNVKDLCKKYKEKKEYSRKCKICLSNDMEILYFPCAHLGCCAECDSKIRDMKCPFCREPIKGSLKCILM